MVLKESLWAEVLILICSTWMYGLYKWMTEKTLALRGHNMFNLLKNISPGVATHTYLWGQYLGGGSSQGSGVQGQPGLCRKTLSHRFTSLSTYVSSSGRFLVKRCGLALNTNRCMQFLQTSPNTCDFHIVTIIGQFFFTTVKKWLFLHMLGETPAALGIREMWYR